MTKEQYKFANELHYAVKGHLINPNYSDEEVLAIHDSYLKRLWGNPDFDDGAVEIIPVWRDSDIQCPQGFTWVADPDGDRLGFYKRYEDDSLQLSQDQ